MNIAIDHLTTFLGEVNDRLDEINKEMFGSKPKQIVVRQDNEIYEMTEDGVFHCTHVNLETEAPCCNGNNCDCTGSTVFICSNPDCDGITDAEAQQFEVNNEPYDHEDWRDE